MRGQNYTQMRGSASRTTAYRKGPECVATRPGLSEVFQCRALVEFLMLPQIRLGRL